MRTLALTGLAALALAGIYSFASACDHSAKATVMVVSVEAAPVPAPTPPPVGSCESVVFEALRAIEAELPAPPAPRAFHFVVKPRPAEPTHPVARSARAAMTLGRAIKTTVEAVMGTLVTAAAEKTAEIV